MYVAVKGGERAIERSWDLLAANRRGDETFAELSVDQIREQLGLAVARVMTEGSVYDEELAALAIKQAAGDLVEAMLAERRISAAFKDIPGGQMLGGTYDYTQRLLDFSLLAEGGPRAANVSTASRCAPQHEAMPRVLALLDKEGLIEQEKMHADAPEPGDLSREPLMFPVARPVRLQNLARADEGFLLAVGYATQRGYANSHPFAGEIRYGEVAVELELEELGFAVEIGDIDITECQMINQFAGSGDVPPTFTQGYGLAFGHSERKAMAMALVDRALRAQELGETVSSPTQDAEFVLYHSDNVEASGFVQHLKLPHYVDFQSELELLRRLRAGIEKKAQRESEAQEENQAQPEPSEENAA